jgi:hypothetical protein
VPERTQCPACGELVIPDDSECKCCGIVVDERQEAAPPPSDAEEAAPLLERLRLATGWRMDAEWVATRYVVLFAIVITVYLIMPSARTALVWLTGVPPALLFLLFAEKWLRMLWLRFSRPEALARYRPESATMLVTLWGAAVASGLLMLWLAPSEGSQGSLARQMGAGVLGWVGFLCGLTLWLALGVTLHRASTTRLAQVARVLWWILSIGGLVVPVVLALTDIISLLTRSTP